MSTHGMVDDIIRLRPHRKTNRRSDKGVHIPSVTLLNSKFAAPKSRSFNTRRSGEHTLRPVMTVMRQQGVRADPSSFGHVVVFRER